MQVFWLLVVDSSCGHNWCLCCLQMEQSWRMWWTVCSASLQSHSAESMMPLLFKSARRPQCPVGNLTIVVCSCLARWLIGSVATPTRRRSWLVGCLTSQQHASVSQGRICSDICTCCHTEIEVADQTFHPTQSQYTDTGPTSPSADLITPGARQGSHWSASL